MKTLLGKLIGVGVGTGQPELITLKALRTLQNVDVICAPKAESARHSMALETVKPLLQVCGKTPEILELVFPMVKDEKMLREAWKRNTETVIATLGEGKNVAFITLGDPMFYSTFIYLYKSVIKKCPNVEVEIVPGITSFTTCAAASKVPIAEAEEIVAVVPSTAKMEKVSEIAKHADTLVFMKGIKNLDRLYEMLLNCGFTQNSPIVMVEKHGTPHEAIKIGRLKNLKDWEACKSYLSTIIIKRKMKDYGQ